MHSMLTIINKLLPMNLDIRHILFFFISILTLISFFILIIPMQTVHYKYPRRGRSVENNSISTKTVIKLKKKSKKQS
jgi:hypothetical protein